MASHSPIHTHIHTPVAAAAMQGASLPTGSNSGFSVLPKDTSTCGPAETGFEPPTRRSSDNRPIGLSHFLTVCVVCGNDGYRTQENSNSTVTQSSETSKSKQSLEGLLDFDSLNNEITQVRKSDIRYVFIE